MKIIIEDVRLSFPALFVPQAIGDGEPAYGAKFILDPKSEAVKKIKAAIKEVAKEKWKDEADAVLKLLEEKGKIAFVEGPYRNSKTGKVYDGFEGMFHINSRTPESKPAPKVFDRSKREVTAKDGVVYGGCYVDASIDIWAQDNTWGRRVNCSLLGVRFVRDGDAFSGSAPASADDFADLEPSAGDDFI